MARVVVGMSGGVDSSVAAALLKEQGYDVIGVMLRLWAEPASLIEDGVEKPVENRCCSLEAVHDARRVAAKLDIPFYAVNVEEPFRETVVDYFYDEYTAGRTPNPCLRCNRQIRFSRLLAQARQLGADWVATGHYARIEADPVTGARSLRMARDQHKDQSYVLHILTRDQLDHALFPLGDLTKPEVRALAAERGLDVASKAESQEVCFVSGNDYRGFLRRYAGETGRAMPRGGVIMDERGETLGAHDGLAGYTIGQRKGLGISAREPLHVLRLDAARNAVVVGPASALLARSFTVRDTTFHRDETGALPFRGRVKVRYKAEPVACEVSPLPGNRAEVRMVEPLRAVTPGQAAVWYGGATDDVVLGGGIIE